MKKSDESRKTKLKSRTILFHLSKMILDKKCCRKGVENLCDEIKNPGGYTKQTLAYHPGVVKFRSDPWLGLNLK